MLILKVYLVAKKIFIYITMNMTENLTFTSKINFVSYNDYQKVISNSRFVPFGKDAPLYVRSPQLFSVFIRTCIAGGITDGKTEALGFHIYDCLEHDNYIIDIAEELQNRIASKEQRGLLIGGKSIKGRPYSLAIFRQLKHFFYENLKGLSYFQEHRYKGAESFYNYDLNTDCWTLCTRNKNPVTQKINDVLTKQSLIDSFKKIYIADGDTLYIQNHKIIL